MFSASGSTETVCDGSGAYGVEGYECLCAKFDGMKVSDNACDECRSECEALDHWGTWNQCMEEGGIDWNLDDIVLGAAEALP